MTVIQCHYDVLGIEQNADDNTIKKSYRKLALLYHPDKNIGDDSAAERFRYVQQAYECLSDPQERKWYDEHRDAILKGWSAHGGNEDLDILFDVVPYMHAGCYNGFGNDDEGFYAVYQSVFYNILQAEEQEFLPQDFGDSNTEWSQVAAFYQAWESFSSTLSFAWADPYDVSEAPNRRVRRAMEDENRKARKVAKRERTDDILALVRFVKKRDPRVQKAKREMEEQKAERERQRKQDEEKRKKEVKLAKEQWLQEQEEAMAAMEEEDRIAGRLRLADLDDDYEYGGGKKKSKKKNKKLDEDSDSAISTDENNGEMESVDKENDDIQERNENTGEGRDPLPVADDESLPEEDSDDDDSTEEEPPDIWQCECCRKDFKSEAQMKNHMNSKKHKEAFKKYQARLEKEIFDDLLDGKI